MSRILIIEDDASIRTLFTRYLESKGYQVMCAGDGVEGLEKLREASADLVITDIMMPEMDGLEVVREIRKVDEKLPVIAISGGMHAVSVNFVSAAQDFGADMIFEKPVALAGLLASVQRLTGQK